MEPKVSSKASKTSKAYASQQKTFSRKVVQVKNYHLNVFEKGDELGNQNQGWGLEYQELELETKNVCIVEINQVKQTLHNYILNIMMEKMKV